MMTLEDIQNAMQQSLEQAGVPTEQAYSAAVILAAENYAAQEKQTQPARTPAQQAIISIAYGYLKRGSQRSPKI